MKSVAKVWGLAVVLAALGAGAAVGAEAPVTNRTVSVRLANACDLLLATRKLLSCKQLSQGSADCTALSVRQVVENALLSDASAVVLAHNHPSGVALPSENDRAVTLWVRDALNTMDIRLLDHIIVADGDFVSMNQSGYLL